MARTIGISGDGPARHSWGPCWNLVLEVCLEAQVSVGRGYAGGADECWEGQGWVQGGGAVSLTHRDSSEGKCRVVGQKQGTGQRPLQSSSLQPVWVGRGWSRGQVDRKSQAFKTDPAP